MWGSRWGSRWAVGVRDLSSPLVERKMIRLEMRDTRGVSRLREGVQTYDVELCGPWPRVRH